MSRLIAINELVKHRNNKYCEYRRCGNTEYYRPREPAEDRIQSGKRVVISAHGNSLRAMVKYLDNIPDDEILGLNIPTGIPLVYEIDDDLTPIRHYYLGDPEAVARATQAVADQLKRKN